MEVVFVHEGSQYRYGFRSTATEVKEEWLYRRPKARERLLFRRVGKDVELSGEFREGRGLADRTRNNALFLSVAAQFDGAIASTVLRWFKDVVRCVGEVSWRSMWEFTTGCLTEDSASPVASRIQALLRAGDLGIAEVKVDREDLGVDVVHQDPSIRSRPVRVVHEAKTSAGDLVRAEFDLRRESTGTQKLFALSGPVADALESGRVFWVDELEAALHPAMTRALVDLFHDPATNTKNAQLLFSSHDATLLSPDRFRRDQIWFVDKGRTGATSLVSLAEYRGVREDEDFMRSYLGGRFGALPFLGGMREAVRGEKE